MVAKLPSLRWNTGAQGAHLRAHRDTLLNQHLLKKQAQLATLSGKVGGAARQAVRTWSDADEPWPLAGPAHTAHPPPGGNSCVRQHGVEGAV